MNTTNRKHVNVYKRKSSQTLNSIIYKFEGRVYWASRKNYSARRAKKLCQKHGLVFLCIQTSKV